MLYVFFYFLFLFLVLVDFVHDSGCGIVPAILCVHVFVLCVHCLPGPAKKISVCDGGALVLY